jgi:hypothetical protein
MIVVTIWFVIPVGQISETIDFPSSQSRDLRENEEVPALAVLKK